MSETQELHITGSIQGVGFRPFIYRIAKSENITGLVQNNGNFVKIIAQGDKSNLEAFYQDIFDKKPPLASIENIDKKIITNSQIFNDFKINKSDTDPSIKTASYIPPDTAICDNCISDMTKGDRPERKNYSFTSCVDCGPRYSVIRAIPYDRPFTTMDEFPFCEKCLQEYTNPLDRRFHAQTTCCRECGPSYRLFDKSGNILEKDEVKVIQKCQDLLQRGKILAIKGISGTHLVCRADDEAIIERLRKSKGDRLRKPFALMSYSIEEIKKYAIIDNQNLIDLLSSPRRPIVLLKKNNSFPLAMNVAPNLHNIGIMLPYSGFHYQLLNNPNLQTLIMTSANRSHLPIEIYNDEIRENLSEIVDFFVLHNRLIHQRVDDSVVKPITLDQNVKSYNFFIRRSRGYTPEPISFPSYTSQELLLGLGSELHTSPAVLTQGKLFFTQYIGNLRYEKTYQFYKHSIEHIKNLLQRDSIYAVGHDLHPLYLSTDYANELKKQSKILSFTFQHHYAHAASLLVDNKIFDDKAIIVTADGLGLGTDNAIWGGEILSCDLTEFERLNHLSYVNQPGGDAATKYPARMVLSYLKANSWSEQEVTTKLPHIDRKLLTTIYSQISHQINSPLTSSTGRFLDTCSNLLGFCSETTYEGEPAIILEGAGWNSIHTQKSNPFIEYAKKNDLQLNFIPIIPVIIDMQKENISKEKIAYYLQDFVGWSYAIQASSHASLEGIKNIGFTGGVGFNEIIIRSFVKTLEKEHKNVNILLHKQISSGDGGIAGGQVALVASALNEKN